MKTSYNPEKHIYEINGFQVPSVTSVLNDVLPMHKAAEWYMQRGQANHACYALLAQGKQFQADPQSDGNIKAWTDWNAEFKPDFKLIERQVYSDKYRFAGTLDAVAMIPKLGSIVLLDYKETLTEVLPYQLGAYAIALKESAKMNVKHGIGVQLTHEGKWTVTPVYDLAKYMQGFLNILSVYNIRREVF